MKRKILPIVFCAILLFIFLNGCGAAGLTGQSNSTAAYAPAVQNENVMDMQDTAETASPGEGVFSSSNVMVPAEISVEQKIIWTVDMEVETLEFDSFLSNLEQEVQRFGGYLESSSVSGSSIQYTEFYTGHSWGDKLNFDLCINTTQTVIKEMVPVITKLFE